MTMEGYYQFHHNPHFFQLLAAPAVYFFHFHYRTQLLCLLRTFSLFSILNAQSTQNLL